MTDDEKCNLYANVYLFILCGTMVWLMAGCASKPLRSESQALKDCKAAHNDQNKIIEAWAQDARSWQQKFFKCLDDNHIPSEVK